MTGAVRDSRAASAHALLPELAADGFEATLLDGDELAGQRRVARQVGELASDAGIALHELVAGVRRASRTSSSS